MKFSKIFIERMKKSLLAKKADMVHFLSESAHDNVSDGQVKDSGDEALSLTMEKLKSSLEETEINET